MNADGGNLRPISAFENFEWTPSVADDGRILYTRWDYIDRFNGHFFSLWSANPDGTNPQLVYGNYTVKPQAVFEARSIPDSTKLIFTAAAHHSIAGGTLALLDRSRGDEGEAPLTRLTPEVPFPETEAWHDTYYASPYPLSEDFYLVGWSDHKLPPHAGSGQITDDRNPVNAMGIYLYDRFGNLELLYRDPAISSMYPIPVRPRKKPPGAAFRGGLGRRPGGQSPRAGRLPGPDRRPARDGQAASHRRRASEGAAAHEPAVHRRLGRGPGQVRARHGARRVGWLGLCSASPPACRSSSRLWMSEAWPSRPCGALTYVLPGQTLSCVGCHESREQAPPVGIVPLAAQTWSVEADRRPRKAPGRCVSTGSSSPC